MAKNASIKNQNRLLLYCFSPSKWIKIDFQALDAHRFSALHCHTIKKATNVVDVHVLNGSDGKDAAKHVQNTSFWL